MPRRYTQIMCAIWDDQEFLELSEGAQRAYLLLVSQRDISAAGVLNIWTPRWVAMSRTSTDDSLKVALAELKQARFIIPDWVTGELLVRSFVRWDGGYTNSKRKPLILREARAVRSVEIKSQLRVEFQKLNLDTSGLPEPPPPNGSDRASDVLSPSSPMGADAPSGSTANGVGGARNGASADHDRSGGLNASNGTFTQVDRASHALFDESCDETSASRGVVGTPVVSTGDPQPHNPQPVPPPAGDDTSPPTNRTDGQALVGHWIDQCRKRPPGTVVGQTGKVIATLLDDGIAFGDIQAGIDAWSAKGLHPAALPAVVNEVMNARPHLRLASGGGPVRIPTTTQRVQGALAHLDPEEP